MNSLNVKKLLAVLSSAAMIAGSTPAMPTMVNAAETETVSTLIGDVNNDNKVTVADSVAILQYIANKDKYNLSGQLLLNGDVYNRGDGITARDALTIQRLDAKMIFSLPESEMETSSTTSTGTTVTTTASTTATAAGTETTSTDVTPAADITYIHLNGDKAEVTGDHAAVSGSVITIDHSGTYYVDGTLSDGQINVSVADEVADPETVKIFLNGASITGKSAPAILITNAENTSINLVDGTENTLSDGTTAYAGDNLGLAVIEAKDDITIKGGEKGTGVLSITANTQDGISCNNDVKINGGTVNITTLNSTDKTDAVKGKTSVTVKDGNLTIDAEGDGIKSSKGSVAFEGGAVSIKAGNDAVQAGTRIEAFGGTVIAGGDRGFTAVEAVNITGGEVYATATDNQVDAKLLVGSTRTVALLNCIDDSTNEKDGMWKKTNTVAASRNFDIEFTKKYKYVLISTTDINGAKSCNFFNLGTDAVVTHTDGKQTQFDLSNVTVFESVDPSGGVTPTETDTPRPPAEQ
ncbi:MAG: carbohydrate-binding domain-containing protein [Ruminococcus sp.]|nr:carbohydrate-binding domain-containing protein [Ruminococcus sp.]